MSLRRGLLEVFSFSIAARKSGRCSTPFTLRSVSSAAALTLASGLSRAAITVSTTMRIFQRFLDLQRGGMPV